MDCKVVWTEPAIDDLREIVSCIAIDDSDAAQRVGFDIIHTVELLYRFPLLGVSYPRTGDGRVREIFCWKYRIFYRVRMEEKVIEIITVWHGARGEPRL